MTRPAKPPTLRTINTVIVWLLKQRHLDAGGRADLAAALLTAYIYSLEEQP